MFSRLGGLTSSSSFLSPFLLASSLKHCIRVSSPCTLYLSYTLLMPRSLGIAMSVLHFLYLAEPYPQDIGNVTFTFLLCLIALCMMYVYLYYICLSLQCPDSYISARRPLGSPSKSTLNGPKSVTKKTLNPQLKESNGQKKSIYIYIYICTKKLNKVRIQIFYSV